MKAKRYLTKNDRQAAKMASKDHYWTEAEREIFREIAEGYTTTEKGYWWTTYTSRKFAMQMTFVDDGAYTKITRTYGG